MSLTTQLLQLLHWNRLRGKPAFGSMALIADAASDGKQYARKDAAWAEVAASGSGDFLSTLTGAEITLNDATTATIGRMHLITDKSSPADYTITLPAVSGNAGKFIGFRVSNSATKFFTIDGNGSEKIWTPSGEVLARVYVRSETCILMCDGTQWHLLYETLLNLSFSVYQGSAQTISDSTVTRINFGTEDWDIGGCYDASTNYRFTPTAPGLYEFGAIVSLNSLGADKLIFLGIRKNGSIYQYPAMQAISVACNPNVPGGVPISLNGTTDYVDVIIYHNHGSNRDTIVANTQTPRFWGRRVQRDTA